MSAVLIRVRVGAKLSVAITIDACDVGCGNKTAASIPVVVSNSVPLAGRPPNCLTEHANFTCWNFSVYDVLSFFSVFKHIYDH